MIAPAQVSPGEPIEVILRLTADETYRYRHSGDPASWRVSILDLAREEVTRLYKYGSTGLVGAAVESDAAVKAGVHEERLPWNGNLTSRQSDIPFAPHAAPQAAPGVYIIRAEHVHIPGVHAETSIRVV